MANPPTGTLTFLFTDIEGSTKMWQRDRETMSEALARHDRILRDVVEERGGYVFKTVGDAFCCAFATAPIAWRRPWRPSTSSSPSDGRKASPSR